MKRCLYFTLLLLSLSCAFSAMGAPAPVKPKAPAVVRLDSSSLQVRTYQRSTLNTYHQQPDFQYREEAPDDSWWTRFWRWFWGLFPDIKPTHGNTHGLMVFLKYLFIVLGLGAILFIILRLIGVDFMLLFRRKSTQAAMPYAETLENIHEIDFDTQLEQAVAQHNYRLAVRLLYLKSLKQLDDAGLIHWELHKTNSAYVAELADGSRRSEFSQLTRQFEYVWYGEFSIDAAIYQHINTLFQHFKQQLA